MSKPTRLLCSLLLAAATPPAARAAIIHEAWYSSQIHDKRIGYLHEIRESGVEGGRRIIRTTLDTQLALKRMGADLNVRSTAVFVETFEGEPLRFESDNHFAASDYQIRAERRGDQFLVTQEALGKKTETEIPYAPDIRFPHAVEVEIAARAMKPGARLEIRTFSPDTARPTRTVIECKREEPVDLGGGWRPTLLRFESSQDLMPGIVLTEWRNDKGVVEKSVLPLLGVDIVSIRTSREKALLGPEGVELLVSTLVDPHYDLPRPRSVSRATFKLKLRDASGGAFTVPTDARQRITGQDPSSLLVQVRRETWERSKDAPAPDPGYLRASSVLQSDDAKVRELALRAAPKGSREEMAKAINLWVNRAIVKKSLSVGLATAAEVARNLTGDCTEHAVLTAAMARARGIPSKVAMGLVYLRGEFGYHMWTEVFDEGWHAIDPAFAQDGADATHIKLAESSLEQGFVDDGLLGLVRLIANLDIEIVDYEIDGHRYSAREAPEGGAIHDRTYENPIYRLRLVAPKRWSLLPRKKDGDAGILVRLEGPGGTRGELRADPVSYDFRLGEWIDGAHPGGKVTRDTPATVASKPGRRQVVESEAGREGLVAFRSDDTLFTLRLLPLGPRDEAALDQLTQSIKFND